MKNTALVKPVAAPAEQIRDGIRDGLGGLPRIWPAFLAALVGVACVSDPLSPVREAYAEAARQDWVTAARHFELALNSISMGASDRAKAQKYAVQSYYNAGITARATDRAAAAEYFGKAIQLGIRAIEAGEEDVDYYTAVIRSSYVKGDYPITAKYEQQLVDGLVRKGQAPSSEQLDMLRSAYVKMNDSLGLLNAFKISLTYQPTPELWAEDLTAIAPEAGRHPASQLQFYRLLLEGGYMKSGDYIEFARAALRGGAPGEAKSVLEQGFIANVITDADRAASKQLLQEATQRAQEDRASLPARTKEVQAAPMSQSLYALGYAYFGDQQYGKAAELLSQALTLSAQNEPDTRLLLGIAQLRAGRRNEALASFAAVRGDPALDAMAQLWGIRAGNAGAAEGQVAMAAGSAGRPAAASAPLSSHSAHASGGGSPPAASAVSPPAAPAASAPSTSHPAQPLAAPPPVAAARPPQSAAAGPAQDVSVVWYPEHRVALVIGNSSYGGQGNIWPDLEGGPYKDADAMAGLLRKLGFEVILAKDQDLDQMHASLRQLSQRIQAAPDTLALLFYSGHGTQAPRTADEEGQDSYLIPVRTNLSFDVDARSKALSLTDIRTVLRHSRAAVVILDACRNNGLRRPDVRASLSRGLASIENTAGMLIAYSTSVGEVADNRPGRMSQYTEALVRELDKPGVSLTTVFRSVRRQLAQSGALRLPELMDALNDDIVLVRPLR